jgi:hypothetical protein
MSLSLVAFCCRHADPVQANLRFDGDWLGAEAWVVAAGLAERHPEADRERRSEDAAGDWLPL